MIYVILGKLKKCRICWLKEQSLFVSGVFFLSRSKVFLPKIQENENFSATFISVWEIGPIPNRTYALRKVLLMVLPNQTTTNFRYKNQFLKPLNRQSFRYFFEFSELGVTQIILDELRLKWFIWITCRNNMNEILKCFSYLLCCRCLIVPNFKTKNPNLCYS